MNNYDILKTQQSHRFRVYYHKDRICNVINGTMPKCPISIEIQPTNKCMLDCQFCAYKENRKAESLELEEFDNLIEEIIKLKRVESVVFSGGGEPSMHPYLPTAINKLVDNGIEVGIMTNGVILNASLLESYKKCSWIRISLNAYDSISYNQITGTKLIEYSDVCENIKRLITDRNRENSKLIVGLSCVVDRHFDCIDKLVLFFYNAVELGVDYVMYRPLEGTGEKDTLISDKEFNRVQAILEKLESRKKVKTNINTFCKERKNKTMGLTVPASCPLGDYGIIVVVSAEGYFFPCINFVKDNVKSKYSICTKKLKEYLDDISIDYSHCGNCRYEHMNEEIRGGLKRSLSEINGQDIHWKFL